MPAAERQRETGTANWLLRQWLRITGRTGTMSRPERALTRAWWACGGKQAETPEPKGKLDTVSGCRLGTTLADPARYPAGDLATLYHERWVRHEVAWSEWNSQKEDRLMLVT